MAMTGGISLAGAFSAELQLPELISSVIIGEADIIIIESKLQAGGNPYAFCIIVHFISSSC